MFTFDGNLNYADYENKTLILIENGTKSMYRSASKICPSVPHEKEND